MSKGILNILCMAAHLLIFINVGNEKIKQVYPYLQPLAK